VGGTDGFGGVEGLEGWGEENEEHCGGEKARESHEPQHLLVSVAIEMGEEDGS